MMTEFKKSMNKKLELKDKEINKLNQRLNAKNELISSLEAKLKL